MHGFVYQLFRSYYLTDHSVISQLVKYITRKSVLDKQPAATKHDPIITYK